MTWHRKTKDAAKGQWRGILAELGIPEKHLNGKHHPCPLCGGEDRFRFDNSEGRGTWICNACGAGDGMALAMRLTGKPYPEMAAHVDKMLGNLKFQPDAPKVDLSEEQRRSMLREVALKTVRVKPGDLVDIYLHARGIGDSAYPPSLRFAAQLPDGEGGIRPAMVSTVQGPGGENVTLHRTFLTNTGHDKAEMESPRKMMPGTIPKGSCVRLWPFTPGSPLGVAEGIETALSAGLTYSMPVWAALNARMLSQWEPPEGCSEVVIFGDNDRNFAGQAAAYALAHRLALKGLSVSLMFPVNAGTDFNDEISTQRRKVA